MQVDWKMEDRKEENGNEKKRRVCKCQVPRVLEKGWEENEEMPWKNTRHDGVEDKEDKTELIENDGLIKHK